MRTSVKAPAKINLTLDVTGKRSDGYHDVKMIMTTVDLADRIHLSLQAEPHINVLVNNGQLPTDENNLAFQAASLLQKMFQLQSGVVIEIDKHIPVSAGLAGGSTDAAAVLRGLNDLWELELTLEELAEIGLQIGSDVPFCVYGGTALAEGRGEKLTFLPAPPKCWVVLAKPPEGVATKEIYKRLQLDTIDHPETDIMIKAIKEEDYDQVCRHLQNVMEAATFELNGDVKKIKERMIESGADGTVMSGSGPTVFSLCRNDKQAFRLYNALKGFVGQVYLVRMLG